MWLINLGGTFHNNKKERSSATFLGVGASCMASTLACVGCKPTESIT